jgi:hypothetical protein
VVIGVSGALFQPKFAQAAVTAAAEENFFGDSGNVVRLIVRLKGERPKSQYPKCESKLNSVFTQVGGVYHK